MKVENIIILMFGFNLEGGGFFVLFFPPLYYPTRSYTKMCHSNNETSVYVVVTTEDKENEPHG